MNTDATNPTPEQLQKAARLGFATHCVAADLPADKTKALLSKYPTLKKAAADRTRSICKALLGGVDSKIFAPAQ